MYGIVKCELTNCPRTAAVLGELAAQWHQKMGRLQRVEQETVLSQSLANDISNVSNTRIDATGNRLRLMDGERLYPKSRLGSTPLAGFAREVAACLEFVDPVQSRQPSTSPWRLMQSNKLQTEENKGSESRVRAKRPSQFIDQLGHNGATPQVRQRACD